MANSHENKHESIVVDEQFWHELIPRLMNMLNSVKSDNTNQLKVLQSILDVYKQADLLMLGNILNQSIKQSKVPDEKNKYATLLNITIDVIKSKADMQNKAPKQAHSGGMFHPQQSKNANPKADAGDEKEAGVTKRKN